MALSKINKDFMEDEEVPEEVEHALIKDSVLEMANMNFKVSDDFDDLPMGSIRLNIAEDLSAEYEGKPVSRKTFSHRNWMDDNADDDLDSDDGDIDSEDGSGGLSDNEEIDSDQYSGDEDLGELSGGESADENDVTATHGSGDSDEGSEVESEKGTKKKQNDEMDINIFSSKAKNVDDDIKKGNAIKSQLLMWENLIECRIKLQKGLAASNRLMQKESFAEFKSQLTPDEDSVVNDAYKGFVDLLENFIKLRECLLKKCPDYVNFKKVGNIKADKANNAAAADDDDDEEIESSESENEDEVKSDEDETPPTKKRKTLDDYSEYLSSAATEYRPFRDSVVQKWNDKTRLASGKIGISKFAILEQTTLKQIEQILLDRDRLVKRTQTRRSKHPVLGKKKNIEHNPMNGQEEISEKASNEEVLDSEIFDDDDFYHKLLKDFIDRKTSDITDPTQLGRQWTKLQKMRSKMKRKVDTRATKGRRIRYTVHNKLVNFMAPIPYSTWEDKVEQDLFRSLFGQASIAPLQNTL